MVGYEVVKGGEVVPVGAFSIQKLNRLLGRVFSQAELVEALENLGCDVEGVEELVFHRCGRCQNILERFVSALPIERCRDCGFEGDGPLEEVGRDRVIRLDLLADRPDLLDVGGLTRALKGYLGLERGLISYRVFRGDWRLVVRRSAPSYRPFIRCAVVRLRVDLPLLREIMRLQEHLHWAIGRDRKLSSIGVYNLGVLTPPIYYTALHAKKGRFTPLGMPGESLSGEEILRRHPKGVGYGHLLEGRSRYPLLVDARGQVLSMPPVINSEETRLREGVEEFFVDVTGTSQKAVEDTLATFLCSLVEWGAKVWSVEVERKDGEVEVGPNLRSRWLSVDYQRAKDWLGLEFSQEEFVRYLEKMRLSARPVGGRGKFRVFYPPYRSDIRHPVDIFEDVAIAVGYSKFPDALVPTMTVGEQREEERISDLARQVMLGLGFTEIMSLMQTTEQRHLDSFGYSSLDYVRLANPKSQERNVVRCHLKTGIMEVFVKNRLAAKPQKFFELGNVVLVDTSRETCTREERRLVFGITDREVGYAHIRAVMDALLRELVLDFEEVEYEPLEDGAFLPNRAARVRAGGYWGELGEVHPRVLESFGLTHPVVLGELCLREIEFSD
ncbi:MAG: phenylalanine--tRNA ligase subunit beta [Planctomycetota bacterium]|nr:MAG: phenylalanine--tRNA ligase subunit beta [Planctomycetota bacterium]